MSLEDPETRLMAEQDPRGFLTQGKRMIIDEIQRLPDLFSYIQTLTDLSGLTGQFIISGSQSFLLNQKISQSLAGRVANLFLFPFGLYELPSATKEFPELDNQLYTGLYPRIYDQQIDPLDFYPNYLETYIQRDVRLLQNIKDLNQFVRFMKLCAGRTGQLLNLSSLAQDTGVSVNTAKAWISVLEASFIIFLLQPHYKNFNKRLVKMPKLYFYDTGLTCSLLGLQSADQLRTHYLRGGIFESFVIAELTKHQMHQGRRPALYFWRDHKGKEIDCLIEQPNKMIPVEIKVSQTWSAGFSDHLRYWRKLTNTPDSQDFIVYGGEKNQSFQYTELLSWKSLNRLFKYE